MRYLPNIITIIRIPLSLSLLLFLHNSIIFIIIYFLCGISDVLDGYIARKMNLKSVLGAKLDSIADFIMYAIIIIVLCLWDWHNIVSFVPLLILVTLIRGFNIVMIYHKFHQLGVIHTIGNKFVGLLTYCIPILYFFIGNLEFLWVVFFIAVIVSLEETCIIYQTKELDLNRRSLLLS